MSNSLWPHGLQHARLSCPSTTPGPCSNSCPLSQWCHWITSSSVIPFFFLLSIFPYLQSFPASGSFLRSQFPFISWPKYWSFSFSISLSKEYSGLICFTIDWFDLLVVQGTLKGLLQHHSSKASIPWCSSFFLVHCHIYTWLLEKPHDCWTDLCWQNNVSAF